MHLGNCYPRSIHADFSTSLSANSTMAPPRKVFLNSNGNFTSGTLALPWFNVDVMSEVGERVDSPLSIRYKLPHPTVSDNFIYYYWIVEETPLGIPEENMYRRLLEFWHGGTKYGLIDSGLGFMNNRCDTIPKAVIGSFFVWTSLANGALFTHIGGFNLQCVIWGQDADYQPYRTRP